MADSPSHQQFIRRFEEGNPSALADLANGKHDYVKHLLHKADELIGGRLCRNYEKEDALQSMFRVLARDFQAGKKRKFEHSGALRRFLMTVLRNRILSHILPPPPDPLSSSHVPIDPWPDRNAHAMETKDLVDAALCRLPQKQLEICTLLGQGLSKFQVSKELACSRRSVDRALEHFTFLVVKLLKSDSQDPAD
jgi:DNA-directed RNA polymerase specialized sigma24 family protein